MQWICLLHEPLAYFTIPIAILAVFQMLLHLILTETFEAQDTQFLSLPFVYSSFSQLCLVDQYLLKHLMSLIYAYRFVHDLYIRFLTTLLLLPFLLYRLRLLLLPTTPTCTSSTFELELLLLSE